MNYWDIPFNVLPHLAAGTIFQHYANEYEEKVFLDLKINGNYHRKIGPLAAPGPDADFGVQLLYLGFQHYIQELPVAVGLEISVEDLTKNGVAQAVLPWCRILCHRSDITHSLLGALLAGGVGYCLYYKVSEGNKKYALYGGAVYASQVIFNHLMFDAMQGPLHIIPFIDAQINIYQNHIPNQPLHDAITLLPLFLSVGTAVGIELFRKYKNRKMNFNNVEER